MTSAKRVLFNLSALITFAIYLCSCSSHRTSHVEENNCLVDSLIIINRINDNTIMVSFGADAITAINSDKGIVIIDAGISTGLTSRFRQKIEKEFQSSNFAYVINTHAHPDHYGGNSVFTESKTIGHKNGLTEIKKQWEDPEKAEEAIGKIVEEYDTKVQDCKLYSDEWYDAFKQKTRYQYAYNDAVKRVPVKKPDLTFSDSLYLSVGNYTFEMKYFGKCHSNSDILIYVPELRLLFSGDLMFQYGRPSINDKSMAEKELWYNAVLWTEKRLLNIEIVVGGHGQLFTIDDLKSFNRIIFEK